MDRSLMSLAEAEAIAATLVDLGYSARAYPVLGRWGQRVIVTGRQGERSRFWYAIEDAGQLPKALDDLAQGLTGGDKQLEEGT